MFHYSLSVISKAGIAETWITAVAVISVTPVSVTAAVHGFFCTSPQKGSMKLYYWCECCIYSNLIYL